MKAHWLVPAGVLVLAFLVGLGFWPGEDLPTPVTPQKTAIEHVGSPEAGSNAPPPSQEIKPEQTADSPQTLPVQWLCAPADLPDAGVPFELAGSREGIRHAGGLVYADRVEFVRSLPDGQYRWVNAAPIWIGRRHNGTSLRINVRSGRITLNQGNDALTEIPLLYMVPVRLQADLVGRTSIRVSVQYTPNNGGDPAFFETFKLEPGSEQAVDVPRGRLEFFEQPEGHPFPSDEAAIASSLGDRAPAPYDLVVLTPMRNVELTISVAPQPVDWLKTAFGGDTYEPEKCTLQLHLKGWKRGEITHRVEGKLSDLLEGPADAPALKPMTILVPPLASDASVEISLIGGSDNDGRIGMREFRGPLARGRAKLTGEQPAYAVELAPIRYGCELLVKVVDTNGNARPDFTVQLESICSDPNTSNPVRYRRTLPTDADGVARFTDIAAGAEIGVEAIVRPQRWKSVSQRVWFADDEVSREIELVIEAEALSPLVFEFVPDAIPEPDRTLYTERDGIRTYKASTEFEYTITTLTENSLHGEQKRARPGDDWRIYTQYGNPGPFTAHVTTPYGEYVIDGAMNDSGPNVQRIELEAFRQVTVTCTDTDGKPLAGAKISTTSQTAQLAWALSAEYPVAWPTGRLMNVTDKKGRATVRRRASESNPQRWTYYHIDHGLMGADEVSGSETDGFTARLSTPESETGTVKVQVAGHVRAKHQYAVLRVAAPGDINDARCNLGALVELKDGEFTFRGVPPGRYQLKVFPESGTAITSPSSAMCVMIDVTAGSTQTVALPAS